jgi:DNA-binding MarR family transcriptional regulator
MIFSDLKNMNEEESNGPLIPERLHGAPTGAKLVYFALKEQAYATTADLSETTGLSGSSIRRATQELAGRNELTAHQSVSDGRQRLYTLSDH